VNEEVVREGFGRILAEAREAKGMSVADISEKLKLTVRQVEALEAEDFSRLPSAVFVRGFARNYARLLGISIDELPGVSERAVEPTGTITAPSEELVFRTSPVRRWLILPLFGAILFLGLVAALYNWLRRGEDSYLTNNTAPVAQPAMPATVPLPPPTPVAPATAPTAPVAPIPPADVSPAPVPAEKPVVPPTATAPTAPATVPAAPATPVRLVPQPASSASQAPQPAATTNTLSPSKAAAAPGSPASHASGTAFAGQHAVHFAAQDEDSWVEVTTADQQRYAKLLHAGEQLTVHGTQPLKVVVGNAAHVQITYDDKPVNLQPYTGEKVARLTLQ
jgi:cytoskeleton protein RodZ